MAEIFDPTRRESDLIKPQEPKRPRFRFGPVQTHYVYEKGIPSEITNIVISPEDRENVGSYGSAILEDFIILGLQENADSEFDFEEAFRMAEVQNKIRSFLDLTKNTAASIDWENLITIEDVNSVKAELVDELRSMGAAKEIIDEVAVTQVNIKDSFYSSLVDPSQKSVTASKYQAVRRGLDYLSSSGQKEKDISTAIKAMIIVAIGHELGHIIDSMGKSTTIGSRIPADNRWKVKDDTEEKKGERFAEFWGRRGSGNNTLYNKIAQRVAEIDVSKAYQVWAALQTYNEKHPQKKLALAQVFNKILESLNPPDSEVSDFIKARRTNYLEQPPENYALPYTASDVKKAFETMEDEPR